MCNGYGRVGIFALFTRRWRVFWRPLQCHYTRLYVIIRVCAKLHNACIDFNMPTVEGTADEDFEEGDSAEAMLNQYSADNMGELSNNRVIIVAIVDYVSLDI